MCSTDDVTKVVGDSEARIMRVLNGEMQKMREEIQQNIDTTRRSHMSVDDTVSNFGMDIKNMQKLLNSSIEKSQAWIEKYTDKIEAVVTQTEAVSDKVEEINNWKIAHQVEAIAISTNIANIEKNLREDISEMKDLLRWLGRLVIGAVILAGITLITTVITNLINSYI